MIGLNSGLLGARRVPTTNSAPGVWVPNEQVLARRAAIWPDPNADANFSSVTLLLHLDGSNGSTTFTDSSSSPLTVSAVNSAQITTAESKFGGASLDATSTGGQVAVSEANGIKMGTGDFTLEMQAYRNAAGTGDRHLFDHGNGAGYLLRWAGGTTLQFYIASSLVCSYTFSFTTSQWYHIAVARSGTSVKLFVDGTEAASGTSSGSATSGAGLGIGGPVSGTGDRFHGYIDEVRLTKGVARYTGSFTAPTAAFPNY